MFLQHSQSQKCSSAKVLEQNISNLVIEILFKRKPSIDLYESNYLEVLLWKSKYRFNYLKSLQLMRFMRKKKLTLNSLLDTILKVWFKCSFSQATF